MMVILREKENMYSSASSMLIKRVTSNLDSTGYNDYDVDNHVSRDNISVNSDLNNLKVYIPEDYEYDQYDIDDFIRSMAPFIRTRTRFDRNIFEMSLSGKLTEPQYIKLVKYIIEKEDFCTIIDENNE